MSDQMEQSQPAARQMGGSPAADPALKPVLVVDNTEQRGARQRAAIISLQERKWAKQIAQSSRPIIVVTEAYAETGAAMSSRIADIFTNVPIVFESNDAESSFFTGKFCDRHRSAQSCIGHFTQTADFDYDLPKQIAGSDCIMVFGSPKENGFLNRVIKGNDAVIVQATTTDIDAPKPQINMARLDKMDKNTDAWDAWAKQVKTRPSL